MLCVRKTLCDAYIICQESHNVCWFGCSSNLRLPALSPEVNCFSFYSWWIGFLFFKILLQVSQTPHGGTEQHWPSSVYQSLSHFVVCGRSRGRGKMRGCVCFTLSPTKWFEIALGGILICILSKAQLKWFLKSHLKCKPSIQTVVRSTSWLNY